MYRRSPLKGWRAAQSFLTAVARKLVIIAKALCKKPAEMGGSCDMTNTSLGGVPTQSQRLVAAHLVGAELLSDWAAAAQSLGV